MEKQFTATTFIVENDQVLLLFHRKLQKWLPPGGHLEKNETPPDGARREVREETGLEIEFILQENLWIDRWNAKSFERPFLCLVEEIPPFGNQQAHKHIDFVYLARLKDGILQNNPRESSDLRWFTLSEIEMLVPDVEIFVETLQSIRHILSLDLTPNSPPQLHLKIAELAK